MRSIVLLDALDIEVLIGLAVVEVPVLFTHQLVMGGTGRLHFLGRRMVMRLVDLRQLPISQVRRHYWIRHRNNDGLDHLSIIITMPFCQALVPALLSIIMVCDVWQKPT